MGAAAGDRACSIASPSDPRREITAANEEIDWNWVTTSGRPNRTVRADPHAAYRMATANSVRLIDHSTPENATTVTVVLLSMSTNERVVAVNARTSSAMRSSGLVSTPAALRW